MRQTSDITLALADVYAKLDSIRPRRAEITSLPGARVFIRPGDDAEFPTSCPNKLHVYDPSLDLSSTIARARVMFDAAGVHHWFAWIAPGAAVAEIASLCTSLPARVWPHVSYPALAREPAPLPRPSTTLTIRRLDAPLVRHHLSDIQQFDNSPNTGPMLLAAAADPDFALLAGLDGDRVVALGLLTMAAGIGYLGFGATHPDFRSRGGQSALIAERVNLAHAAGCTLCISETLSFLGTSMNNLKRAGFECVFEWTVLEVGEPSKKGD